MIHLNIGSNLNSNFGNRFVNISIAIKLLIKEKFIIKKISNFYTTPSYPNKRLPNFLNIGLIGTFSRRVEELRNIIDGGKKDIKKGVLIAFSIHEGKIGVSVGVTKDLIEKFDAVELVKIASSILGGKGGGGRKDFAQAGGINKDKIQDAFKALNINFLGAL